MSINNVAVSGYLSKEPDLRQTQSGMAILSFGICVNDKRKNQKTGEWEDYPNFIDCKMFGAYAESMSQHLHKGTKAVVEGKLNQQTWEKDGQKRSRIEIIVNTIDIMSLQQPKKVQSTQSYGQPTSTTFTGDDIDEVADEEIPF